MSEQQPKIVLVTGANQGIGYCIAKKLVASGALVILGCRSQERAATAADQMVAELQTEGKASPSLLPPRIVLLDLGDSDSIPKTVSDLQSLLPAGRTVDVLVNNAAILLDRDAPPKSDEERKNLAEETLKVNVWNTIAFTSAVSVVMTPKTGRVVYVSSLLGALNILPGAPNSALSKVLDFDSNPIQPLDKVYELAKQYVECCGRGPTALVNAGWPADGVYPSYSVSKVLLNAYVRIVASGSEDEEARKLKGLTLVSCSPGWVRTRMTGGQGHKTPDEGADTPFWLTGLDDGFVPVNGAFYADRKRTSYATGEFI